MDSDKPGREVPKDYRPIINSLISQGWRYDNHRKGHPMLFPADKSMSPVTLSKTPSDHHDLENFKSKCRNRGGII